VPIIDLPHEPTRDNAPNNGDALATMLRDAADARFNGRRPAEGGSCKMCGLTPPSGRLFEIILDPDQDLRVRVGIGRCHGHHLRNSVSQLLAVEERGHHPDRETRVRRLRDALRHLV